MREPSHRYMNAWSSPKGPRLAFVWRGRTGAARRWRWSSILGLGGARSVMIQPW